MKLLSLLLVTCLAVCGLVMSGLVSTSDASVGTTHRYLIQRTFPQGALEGLDAAAKAKVNQTNARFGVKWLMSFANADRTRTFCIYEGPTEQAIRDAAAANHLPVDAITEVPLTLEPR